MELDAFLGRVHAFLNIWYLNTVVPEDVQNFIQFLFC